MKPNARGQLAKCDGPPVQATLQPEATDEDLPKKTRMIIDGRDCGETALDGGKATLSPAQTATLLHALPKATRLVWTANGKRWPISVQGANAVLLKMDAFQGRVGTPGALIRKGTHPESAVLAPLPVPVITAAQVTDNSAQPSLIPAGLRGALFADIRKTISTDQMAQNSCEDFETSTADPARWHVYRLSNQRLLVSAGCWSAAYNSGAGYWVVHAKAPYAPQFVTNMGTGYADGTITSSQRGRGLGDCMGSDSWTWDGTRFVHTESMTTGMCKHIAPGGAWELPTLVVKVNEAK